MPQSLRRRDYVSWVKLALATPPWPADRFAEAQRLRGECDHLGAVAERLGCSVFELQAELGIGRERDIRAYRRVRTAVPKAAAP